MNRAHFQLLLLSFCIQQHGPSLAQLSWKQSKNYHYLATQEKDNFINNLNDISFLASGMENRESFLRDLNNILIPRTVGSVGHAKVKSYIENRMTTLGWTVEMDSFQARTPMGVSLPFSNIIATQNQEKARRLVLACHYDSKLTPEGFVGATDSAVPCAMLINLAESFNILKHFFKDSDVSLQLIFFDGEEAFLRWNEQDSLYGSRHLAKMLKDRTYVHEGVSGDELDRIDVLMLLDLIGTSDTSFVRFNHHGTGLWYNRLITIEDNLRSLGLVLGRQIFKNETSFAIISDDHVPFQRKGVNILHLISYPFPKVWHKISDNIANVDFERTMNILKILRIFVTEYLGVNN